MQPHVLVVEDEDALSELLSYNLKKEGFRVSLAADGEEAMMLVEERQPDVVVLDVPPDGVRKVLQLLLWKLEALRDWDKDNITGVIQAVAAYMELKLRDLERGKTFTRKASFIFIGAGGGSLPLLQKAGVSEIKGYGGFPIGGQWLICEKPEIVDRHEAKVYGLSPGAAPTMAVPHLDSRFLEGKKALLFGPYAAWTTKFLHKGGSFWDLPGSIKFHNWFRV